MALLGHGQVGYIQGSALECGCVLEFLFLLGRLFHTTSARNLNISISRCDQIK